MPARIPLISSTLGSRFGPVKSRAREGRQMAVKWGNSKTQDSPHQP
jgi:hypothetical protein